MIIQLLNAFVSDEKSSGRQLLKCSFSIDGTLREMDIEVIRKGKSSFLALDSWEDMFQGQDQAFQKMREWLFLPLHGLPLPENAWIELEEQVTEEEDYSSPKFF